MKWLKKEQRIRKRPEMSKALKMRKSTPDSVSLDSVKSRYPDIANSGAPVVAGQLARVGMDEIEIPLKVRLDGQSFLIPAFADAHVNLAKPKIKGIHMSRLFLALQNEFEKSEFSLSACSKILEDFLESHEDISDQAFLNIRFNLPLKRKALISQNFGWRYYPVAVRMRKDARGEISATIALEIKYSSTCPCSAALARQLIQKKFEQDFKRSKALTMPEIIEWLGSEEGVIATPHGQRSLGKVEVGLKKTFADSSEGRSWTTFVTEMIDKLEDSLATPVQTAVKREDEQEFARLNGQNLMFAEDAARKMDGVLRKLQNISGFRVKAVHLESLHPHDAVATSEWNVDELV